MVEENQRIAGYFRGMALGTAMQLSFSVTFWILTGLTQINAGLLLLVAIAPPISLSMYIRPKGAVRIGFISSAVLLPVTVFSGFVVAYALGVADFSYY